MTDQIDEDREGYIKSFNLWDKSVLDFIKPIMKFEECNVTYKNDFYDLNDGILTKIKVNTTCYYSCKYYKSEFENLDGPLVKIDSPILLDCDVFYIKCYDNNGSVIFEDVNFHARKLKNIPKRKANFLDPNFKIPINNKFYDVHIYVIDSLSYYQALRALKKTRNYLINELNGIEMKLLNIVAKNSKPNAFGFLLNKNVLDIHDTFNIKKKKPTDLPKSCIVPLDNTTFIQDYYKNMGYVTLNTEDFLPCGVFSWPDCIGFKEKVADYMLRPLQVLQSYTNNSELINNIFKQKCYNRGFHIMNYMEDFLQKNKDRLKMSLLWQVYIEHDDLGSIFASDEIYYNYFKRNEKFFDNSFNILMSDHGYRRGSYLVTEIARFEHKNPYFIITIPKDLRTNERLIRNLKENSNKHISHFDVYATLLDLLTIAPKDGFKNFDKQEKFPIINDNIKGLSLLRPLPYYNRSCYEMYIPPQYCLKNIKFVMLPKKFERIYNKLAFIFIRALNRKINNKALFRKCAKMKLDKSEPFIVEVAGNSSIGVVYRVNAVTNPGKAKYETMINSKFEIIGKEIVRMNDYKDQAEKISIATDL
uniref:Sulfatase N-terminal domain-containing protein n=1 Tax=Strongyloides stercoralis TaxID=6248 RepID=A0AAF5D1U3_STRER